MLSLRSLLVSGALGALAITALGVPASAADTQGTLAIVNGIPGKRVDVCINGSEIGSGLRYGRTVLRNVISTGNKNLKVYERDPRTCRGTLLAQDSFPLGPGDDLTIVATKNAPKVVTFDNRGAGEIPPLGAPVPNLSVFFWRHAADLTVNFKYRLWTPGPETPVAPTADPLWVKGDEAGSVLEQDTILQLRATLPEDPDTIAIKRVEFGVSRRYEWILVGTNPGNTKFVLLDRAISQPSP